MTDQLVFLARRTDGLGERLRAMLNAVALSNVYGAQFRFCWDDTSFNRDGHSIDDVSKIFSKQFIEKYHVENVNSESINYVSEYLQTKKHGVYFLNQTVDSKLFKNNPSDHKIYKAELNKSFKEIEFCDSILEVVDNAKRIDFKKEYIAIHLRAGDIVYEEMYYSFSNVNKVIPFPIACDLIENLIRNDYHVLIFGQDINLNKYLAKMKNVTLASDFLPPNLNSIETAFFEIILMSRCQCIYSGGSGFAILSSMVSGAKYINPIKDYERNNFVNIIFESLFAIENVDYLCVSKQQIALACKSAFINGADILGVEDRLRLINFGKKEFPDNFIFHFMDAWEYYVKSEADFADKIISYWVNNKSDLYEDFCSYNFGTRAQVKTMQSLFDPSIIKGIDKPATENIYRLLTKY